MKKGKVTDYSEYTITVASMKLPGVLTSSGNNILADVYAVKDENSTEWEAMARLPSLNTKKDMNTKYVSVRRATWIIAWATRLTEYELLEVISKEHKNSENLPPHFIPNWYFEKHCSYINPNLPMPLKLTKKRRLKMTLKPM